MIHKTGFITGKALSLFSLFLVFYFLVPACAHALSSDLPSTRINNAGEGGASFGKEIMAIEVKGLTRIKEEELIGLICFGVGDTLDREVLREGIRRAFKKGIFYDIKAESGPYDNGIRLTYIVREIPVVNRIIIEGNRSFSDRKIKNSFPVREGEDLREDFLSDARDALVKFYERKGFPGAGIKVGMEAAKKPAMVDIHINIKEGPPLVIKKINAPDNVRRFITLSEGDTLDRDKIDKSIQRISRSYKKRDYLNPLTGPYSFVDGELDIPVYPGPKLELKFKGNKAISARKLGKEAHFIEDGEVTDELLAETADRIKRLYVSKGYYYAGVTPKVEREENVIRVTFSIFEGTKVVLKNLIFTGISIDPAAIKRVVPLTENKPFNNNMVNSGRESLTRFYNALGYLQVEVVDIKKEFLDDGGKLNLEFVVNEGPRTKVKSVTITGNSRFDKSELRSVLGLKEGSPYNVIDIGDARHRALSFYGRHGYLDASVEVESVIENGNASLTFRITENRPSIVGKIILRGNRKTKPKIINRELNLEEGELYNYDEITGIKQRLYKLGIFNKVSVDILEPQKTGDDELLRDMLVSLSEGNAGSVEISAGFGDYERFRGSIDISYRNLGGYHRQVGFRSELSSVEERYIFNFKEPRLFNKPGVPFKAFLLKEYTRSINIETRDLLYEIERTSFIAGIEKKLGKGFKAGLGYEYSFIDTKNVDPGIILSREDTGTIGISSLSPSLFWDTRDDPFEPASGALQGLVVKYASSLFLSETEFIKGTFQSSWFFQMMKRVVFAFSLRGGAAYGFEESEEIPLIERFFLGGRTTVRGYSHDTLGPRSENGAPTGGNIFALTNWEFRFSAGKGFGFVTFIDAGNVWETADDVDDELKYTAGLGLRYSTPVGPVRLDYGHKLNKEPGESSGEFHFSFGHAF
ncbi:MAG TPA: outer membrane protein assembly factor BamA [Nitrospirae bacterium]|nr:outer membrane protein assembly factor BamA [Nitrospirota bacterium]